MEVKSASDVWKLKSIFHFGPKRYLFLNWLEDRVLSQRSKPRWLNLPVFLYRLLIAKAQRIDIVWVRHNYRPHTTVVPEWVCGFVYWLMGAISSRVVVHSQSYAEANGYHYLPHPLYEPCVEKPSADFIEQVKGIETRIAVIGQVRPSKQFEQMLEEWPREIPLFVSGKPSSDEYGRTLMEIARRRDLNASFILRQIETSEFDYILRAVKAIYIANPDNTMIVSGVYFHAASLGTPMIMRASKFADEMASRCRFTVQVLTADEIANAINELRPLTRNDIICEAETLFGLGAFKQHFSQLNL